MRLGKPKIRELYVPIDIQQDVLWLEVTVDDLLVVEVVEPEGDFGEIEPGLAFCEPTEIVHVEEKLPAGAEV